MHFDNFPLTKELLNNLDKLGFTKTTDIQYKAIPPILNGEDLLAIAQTGTGKSAAFAIPVIQKIHNFKTSRKTYGVKAIVLAPTRELSKQLGQLFSKLSKSTKVNTFALYGGVDQDPQIDMLQTGIDILITTPGRMFDLISQGHIDVENVSTLIIDEADQMLDLGFSADIRMIKAKIKNRSLQTLFLSATINPKIKKLAYSQIKSNAMRITISPEQIVSKNVYHFICEVEMDEKRHLLTNFLKENPGQKCIVFVRTQVRAERVANHLYKNGIFADYVHGGLEQRDRITVIDEFSNAKDGVIIATDLSARGIDFKGIKYVINYDLPEDPENYVHRVGRTGRGNQYGEAISFYSPEEKDKKLAIEDFLGHKLEERPVNESYLVEEAPESLDSMSIADMLEAEENLFMPKKKKKKK